MKLLDESMVGLKHHFSILDASGEQYRMYFYEREQKTFPQLNTKITHLMDKGKIVFPEADLVPQRVGVAECIPGSTALNCFPVSWAQFTALKKGSIKEAINPEEWFKCLTVCVVVKTKDEHIVLSRRGKKVSTYKNMWHVAAAGYVDLHTAKSTETALFQALKELQEEVGIVPTDIVSIRTLGLCEHLRSTPLIEICYEVKVDLTSEELKEKAQTAIDRWESQIYTFTFKKAEEMLRSPHSKAKFNPAGGAALLLSLGS